MDRRDELTWIAIELTHLGETKVEDGSLEETLRADLGASDEHPLFIPAETYDKGNKIVVLHVLMQGYVFVASGLPETRYYQLEGKPYVSSVVSAPSGPHQIRTLSTIPNSKIEEWRLQLRSKVSADICEGDSVVVCEGRYRTLEGVVTAIDSDVAYLRIELRSLKIIAPLPLVFLEVATPEEDGFTHG